MYEEIEITYDKGYKRGYEEGRKNTEYMVSSAYKHGMEESWECARTIINKYGNDFGETRKDIFGYGGYKDVINNLTASEAVAKIKEYEEQQKQDAEIKVGDEVITEFGYKGIVITDVPCKEGNISVWSPTCTHVQMYPVKKLTKTGRHFDQIAEVLNEMRGEE